MSAATQVIHSFIIFMIVSDATLFTARSTTCNMAKIICKPYERPSCLIKSVDSAVNMSCCSKQLQCLYCWSRECPNFESLTCSNYRGVCRCFCKFPAGMASSQAKQQQQQQRLRRHRSQSRGRS
uniref:Uncharacterized protein n=1 Tax=Rhipicephalus appendiculatus TaxID=34631 RepID=A0A131YEY8_RHIAP